MTTVSIKNLPMEAEDILLKVRSSFAFAHKRDGIIYKNREGLLPEQSLGYYREYTVPTVDAQNRGTRRLVIGSDREVYYTDDHYQTFRQVIE